MSKAGLISLIVAFLVLTVFFLREVPSLKAQAQSFQPLEGTLLKARIEALDKADVPMPSIPKNIPTVSVFVKDPRQAGLLNATEFIGKVVPESDAKVELGLVGKRLVHFKKHKAESVAQTEDPTPVSPPAKGNVSDRMMTFSNLDAALNASDASFPLNNRFQKGGITFQLLQIGKWNGFYLLKYSLNNDEEREFFIASVQLVTGGVVVPSESFVPFSCLPHSSVMGIAKFAEDGLGNKILSIILEESGGKYLKLEIKDVDYKF